MSSVIGVLATFKFWSISNDNTFFIINILYSKNLIFGTCMLQLKYENLYCGQLEVKLYGGGGFYLFS